MLRLIARCLIDSRMTAAKALPKSQVPAFDLWRERVDHSVDSSPCALDHTVRDILSGYRSVLRHVPRRADRPSLDAPNANAEREK